MSEGKSEKLSAPSHDHIIPWSAPPLPALKRPVLQSDCTPVRQKASSLPISEPAHDNSTATGSSPSSKRRRLNSQVQPLLRAELQYCTFKSLPFLEQFQLIDSAADIGQIHARRVLEQIVNNKSLAEIYSIKFRAATGVYTCLPRSYSDVQFPQWFCKFANAVSIGDVEQDHHGSRNRSWVVTKAHAVSCHRSVTLIRPDFIVTTESSTSERYSWEHVLVVGEHESKGSVDHGLSQLASYAEQVLIAQPFRMAVFGLITGNSSPVVTFWRFDRAGKGGPHYLEPLEFY